MQEVIFGRERRIAKSEREGGRFRAREDEGSNGEGP